MNEKLLIVEDEFIVANDLSILLENAGYHVCGIADTVDLAKAAIAEFSPTWVLLDIFLQDDSKGTELAPYLQELGIGFIYISANTNQSILESAKATQPYGFLVKPFREKDLLIMLDIARGKHESSLQFAAQRDLLFQQQIKNLADGQNSFKEKLSRIPSSFQSLIPFDYLAFHYTGQGEKSISGAFYRAGFDEYQILPSLPAEIMDDLFFLKRMEDDLTGKDTNSKICAGESFTNLTTNGPGSILRQYKFSESLQFMCNNAQGVLQLAFFNKTSDAFDHSHSTLLTKSYKNILKAFNKLCIEADSYKSVRPAARVQPQKLAARFEGIIGNSAVLLHVLDNIELVANTLATVLILGESGTGKEKVAYNIHLLSSRSKAAFVTINCAALPAELIESELFGHAKGAFTGAIEKRTGKFEMAQGGTIFLDEIGDLPIESQVKLLRVLQEKQFESIGSNKTIKVDVRIIAATNRNLEKEVAEGRFRLDLFYRLNVYPIQMPPLRDRKEDIPLLAEYFLRKSGRNMERHELPQISPFAMQQLSEYHWPGNIRELEHLMERTLIKTRKDKIEIVELPVTAPERMPSGHAKPLSKPLDQIEAEHILFVLKSCNGKITGSGGAAEVLGLPPSTLTSRMKKLGIKKELYHER